MRCYYSSIVFFDYSRFAFINCEGSARAIEDKIKSHDISHGLLALLLPEEEWQPLRSSRWWEGDWVLHRVSGVMNLAVAFQPTERDQSTDLAASAATEPHVYISRR